MTKKQKSAKKSFISSVLVLCLCFTMFVGTTFAWYNDSVTSGRNTIVSGSLEMVLEKYIGTDGNFSKTANWETVTDQTKIFNETDNKLTFEPGAVQVAYVRVKNEGDLAFKYSLAAKVYEEKAGTNQAGDPFLLSTYLKFGQAQNVTAPFATREAAISAIGTAGKISDTELVPTANLQKKTTSGVIALVIYLPSETGNIANPLPNAKPEISFGLNALATQYTIERDSFSEDYDGAATMPAMESSAPVAASGATTITTGPVTVTVPADATDANDTELTLKVKNFADNATTGAVTMDITLVDQDDNAITQVTNPIVVEINVGPGKAITSVSHNNTPVTNYTYNDQTGILRFETASFSPFAITYKVGKGVSTPAELDAALADPTITEIFINSNYDGRVEYFPGSGWYSDNKIDITSANGAKTIDFSGGIFNGIINVSNATITFKNGTLNRTVSALGSSANVTLKDCTINTNPTLTEPAIEVKNGGIVVIENTVINFTTTAQSTANSKYYAIKTRAAGASKVIFNSGSLTTINGEGIILEPGTEVVINGGTFDNAKFDCPQPVDDRPIGKLTINGGTFDADPSAYVPDNYTATESNGIWTVQVISINGANGTGEGAQGNPGFDD